MSLIARKPSQQLVDLVGTLGGKWSGKSALCRCPAHDDRLPSLSIRQGDHGFLVHCFAGCDNVDVLRELGRIYTSRALSFAGVEYDILKHELTPQQIEIYDTYAEAWAVIHQNMG